MVMQPKTSASAPSSSMARRPTSTMRPNVASGSRISSRTGTSMPRTLANLSSTPAVSLVAVGGREAVERPRSPTCDGTMSGQEQRGLAGADYRHGTSSRAASMPGSPKQPMMTASLPLSSLRIVSIDAAAASRASIGRLDRATRSPERRQRSRCFRRYRPILKKGLTPTQCLLFSRASLSPWPPARDRQFAYYLSVFR